MSIFNLANPLNGPGNFRWIEKDLLIIPEDLYQRGVTSQKKIKAMVENWDWLLCATLIVIERKGKYYVNDGGHRKRAADQRDDIEALPCMVYQLNNIADEAKAFVGGQTERTPIATIDRHRALLLAKDPIAVRTEKIITDYGYTASRTSCSGNFDAISALRQMVIQDDDCAEVAFMVCAEIAGGERIYHQALKGVYGCERASRQQRGKTIATDANIEKLKKVGMVGIVQKVNAVSIMAGKASCSQQCIAARAILDLLNKGKRGGSLDLDL